VHDLNDLYYFAAVVDHGGFAAAERALRRLPGQASLSVSWSPVRARPVAVRGLRGSAPGTSPAERARRFLGRHPDLFPPAEPARLALIDVRHAAGWSFVRFQQLHQGIPVEAAEVIVALDQDGLVRSVSSEAARLELPVVRPGLDATAAARAAVTALGLRPELAGAASARLVVLPLGSGRLVYRVVLPYPEDSSGRAHLVDARSGVYLGSRVAAIVEKLQGEVRR
jgi:DNA-binding transcriptional LysR family regulator